MIRATKPRQTIRSLVMDYFMRHPKKDLPHGPVVDWVTKQWLKTHRTPPRDVWRMIRRLHEEGILIKVRKGVYRYDPDHGKQAEVEDFTPEQREAIFKRDNYRCVICGRGPHTGDEIHADHIIPKSRGGKAEISNGQTLCSQHNLLKKNLGHTETGKKLFINLYKLAKQKGDSRLVSFFKEILEIYKRYGMNDHIPWDE